MAMDQVTQMLPAVRVTASGLGHGLAVATGLVVLGFVGVYVAVTCGWLIWDLARRPMSAVGHALWIPLLIAAAGEEENEHSLDAEEARRADRMKLLDRDPALLRSRDVARIIRLARRADPDTYERCYSALGDRWSDEPFDEDTRRPGPRIIARCREAWLHWRIERWLARRSW